MHVHVQESEKDDDNLSIHPILPLCRILRVQRKNKWVSPDIHTKGDRNTKEISQSLRMTLENIETWKYIENTEKKRENKKAKGKSGGGQVAPWKQHRQDMSSN